MAIVSKKVAQEIASGVDIEAAAFDYNLPDPPSVSQPQQEDDGPQPGEGNQYDLGRDLSQDISPQEAREQDPRGESSYGGGYYRAKGGLIEKPKLKAKKMKRGGLASKK